VKIILKNYRTFYILAFSRPILYELYPRPQRFWHIKPGTCGTFLSAVLEGGADGAVHNRGDIRGRVYQVVVLATALANQTRKVPVLGQVVAHLRPQPVESPAMQPNFRWHQPV
jgi:hypothetical protein